MTEMKSLTVQEASCHLTELLHSAVEGEEITIRDGAYAVLLQPVVPQPVSQMRGREALRRLQAQSKLTPALAETYLQDVKCERLAGN